VVDSSPPAPQRVVLFGSFAPSLILFRGSLIAALIERGHKVFALAPEIDAGTASKLKAMGAEPRSVALGRTSLDPFEAARTSKQLRELLRQIRPDAVIAYTIKPVVLGGPAARSAGARFIPLVTGLGYAFTGGREPKRVIARLLATHLYRRAFRSAETAIFQNPDDLAEFRRLRLLPRRLPTAVINGSGIDTDHFSPRPLPREPSFLMIARLLGDKGIREYGEAAKRLKQVYPQVRVSLVGHLDSSPDSLSQAQLDDLIAGGIDYLGALEDVRPALAAHSIYVLPSYREGTPRSVLEALAMGRPVITTDAPGCRETVVPGVNGSLVPPRDAEALHAAMARMIEDTESLSAMGEASRRIAEEKYDVSKVNADILRLARL
jgi:glycosyltransferase involved in cell wall biosynthesis